VISISHWGMFEVAPRMFVLPAGYRLPSMEEFDAEMARPDGIVRLIKIEPRQRKGWFNRLFGVS
jgi:hypothetical protein